MLEVFGIILSVICISASADIYQWTDEKGIVHYSDSIPKTGKTKDGIRIAALPNITTIQATQPQEHEEETQHGPKFTEISNSDKSIDCNSTKIASIDRNNVLDAWQDRAWKECHGMKQQ